MGLYIAGFLLPLCFLAVDAEVPLEERYPRAVEAYHCDFDQASDANYDAWPDGWTRRRGAGYPSFVKIQIQPVPPEQAEFGVRQCLRVDLDGGGAAAFSPPVEVDAAYCYALEGLVRADNIKHDRVFLSLTFLDAEKRPLVAAESEASSADAWKKISLGPVAPPSRDTKTAVVGLNVEPRGGEDLKGSASFAEIRLVRLPRLELKTNQPCNLSLLPAKVEATCTVSGFSDANTKVVFELLDVFGRRLAEETRNLGDNSGGTGANTQNSPAPNASKIHKVHWEPLLPGPGFYRIKAELRSGNETVLTRGLTLAAVEPRRAPAGGMFGWTLPNGDHPIPLGSLATLLNQAGINLVKYPLWFDADDNGQLINQYLDFCDQLNSRGIGVVGLLNDPPETVRRNFGSSTQISAADLFGADMKSWFPSLEPIVTQLTGWVRWWQLGDDADDSFSTAADYMDKLAKINAQFGRAAPDINLGIGWDCGNVLPPKTAGKPLPWKFAALTSRKPISPAQLAEFLAADKKSALKLWVSIKPLPKKIEPDRQSASFADIIKILNNESNSTDNRATYAEHRVKDLLMQMIEAKIRGADAVFCQNPFDPNCGLMNVDGTPGELFLPWRTAALELGTARFLGEMQLPRGSKNMVFDRADDAVMVLWNAKTAEETLYLGDNVKQVDPWGRESLLETRENNRLFRADALPSFVTGLNKPLVHWQMDFCFDRLQMPCVSGLAQDNGLKVKNPFSSEASGTATVVAPRGWIVEPRQVSFRLAPNKEFHQPIAVTFPEFVACGRHPLRIDFEIQTDRPYKFSAYRHIEVGLGDVRIEVKTRLNAENVLEVEQRFLNTTDQPAGFRCELSAPGRRSMTYDIVDQEKGQNLYTYRLGNGKELLGKTLWLKADEIDGARTLNYRFTVKSGE